MTYGLMCMVIQSSQEYTHTYIHTYIQYGQPCNVIYATIYFVLMPRFSDCFQTIEYFSNSHFKQS